jgi:hypothetical protein
MFTICSQFAVAAMLKFSWVSVFEKRVQFPENEPISYFFKEDIYYEKAS